MRNGTLPGNVRNPLYRGFLAFRLSRGGGTRTLDPVGRNRRSRDAGPHRVLLRQGGRIMGRRLTTGFAGVAVVVLGLATGAAAAPAPGFTELVSISSAGAQGDLDSE